MELLKKRLANLLAIKSIVTVALTAVFAHLTVHGQVSADQFLTVFTVVVAFYFGTQAKKDDKDEVVVTQVKDATDEAAK